MIVRFDVADVTTALLMNSWSGCPNGVLWMYELPIRTACQCKRGGEINTFQFYYPPQHVWRSYELKDL